jgi:hypothetical protein
MPSIAFVGYFVQNVYFTYACEDSVYQSIIKTINMCYPKSAKQSYVYSDVKAYSDSIFSMTTTTYGTSNCTGHGAAVVTNYSTECIGDGQPSQAFSYSATLPSTDSGVMTA